MNNDGGITSRGVRDLERLQRKLDNGIKVGPGLRIVNRPDGILIELDQPPQPSPTPAVVVRMKVSDDAPTDPATDDDAQDNVVLANFYDGTTTGEEDIPVRTNQSHSEGDEILVVQSQTRVLSNDGTEVTFNGLPVVWQETLSGSTDYTVYISAIVAGSDKGGKYTGYCYQTAPPFIPPTTTTPCEIWIDDEIKSVAASTIAQQHWAQVPSVGIGRFDGEYNSDTPPKPIIHATGFAPRMAWTLAGVTLPFATQKWQRQAAYADTTNPANLVTGDEEVSMSIATRQDGTTKVCSFRRFYFDASGRIYFVDQEGT